MAQQWFHPKIADAETTVRREWQRIGADDPTLSLAALVELVSHRYSIWPSVLGLHTPAGNLRARDPCAMFP